MTLSDKREELLKEWLGPRNGVEREIIKQVFDNIEEQDKQFIKDLIKVGLKKTLYPKYLMLTMDDLHKLAGPKLI